MSEAVTKIKVQGETDIITLEKHGRNVSISDTGGKVLKPWHHGRPYESPLLEHIYERNYKGLAVDVGAGIGNHTIWFAAICELDVMAFEPIVPNFTFRNIVLNDMFHKVTLHCMALGTKAGKQDIMGRGVMREVRTLDSYNLQDVAFIKVDVEEMEPDVLIGAENTIARYSPVIYAEEFGIAQQEAIANILEPWGYYRMSCFSKPPTGTPMAVWEKAPQRKRNM